MEAFVWDDSYAVGEAQIDDEHRELVRIVNEVIALSERNAGEAALAPLLDRLVRYAATHFRHEEAFMTQSGVDDRHAVRHKAIHGDFTRQILRLRAQPLKREDMSNLARFLTGWLIGHILREDRAMVRQAERIRAGGSAVDAYLQERSVQIDPATHNLLQGMDALYRLIDSRSESLAQFKEALEEEVAAHAQDKELLSQIIDSDPVPTFVLDAGHRVTHWNRACALVTGVPAERVVGTTEAWRGFYPEPRPVMADLVISGDLERGLDTYYAGKFRPCATVPGAYEAEADFPNFPGGARALYFTAAPLRDAQGRIVGAIETLQDITERRAAELALREAQTGLEGLVEKRTEELVRRNAELTQLNHRLSEARQQLVQSEKLASIGQLAAGVAHEINNPIGYVHSNIGALEKYLEDVFAMLAAYQEAEASIADPARAAKIAALRKQLDLDFLSEDIPMLMGESKEGIARVKKIVQDLKDFSRVDSSDEFQWANLHHGIDSTLNIVANEIKYKADVIKEYGELPDVECLPSQINQVIMNLCVNAAHAMGETRGRIVIRTGCSGEQVWIEVADDGCGIPPANLQKIFDPFFTTKPVGKGTGLGLSLSYGIVKNHNGTLTVDSEVGKGTTFRITLPVRHAPDQTAREGGA